MGLDAIDKSTRAAIRRLTSAERECLKRCLSQQTAKQMALDLGISPHAVEKRLKMARAKLGLSSSLEAAKLVESLERFGRLVPHSSDLSSGDAGADDVGSVAAPRTETARIARRYRAYLVSGATLMSVLAAAVLVIGLQTSGAVVGQPTPSAGVTAAPPAAPSSVPSAGTEAALRSLVAGLASGSPDYEKLSPPFAEIVRRDLPMTHGWFGSLGKLESVTFRGRGVAGDDVYDLVFANGEVMMSARLDAGGRMQGGLLQPLRLPGR
jgi:DNA-binding CsgD family transcriptional regulator